jgi:hypothetical protein
LSQRKGYSAKKYYIMQPNNNLSCIPFYTSLEEQDYRKWYAYGEKYPHRVPSDYLLPFYFVIPPTPSGEAWVVYELVFYRVCCDEAEPITGSYFHSMADNNLVIRDFGTFAEVIYYASHNARLDLPKGLYYIKMVISCAGEEDRTYYSDIFFVDSRENLEANSIKLEWWNEDNLEYDGGLIPYGEVLGLNRFKSDIFLDTEIGKPTYNFTEEGEERNGHFFPIKQISEKSYNFGFVAPEYLCDVMRLIRMADVVRITDKLGRVYNVEQFEMDVNWLEQGHYAEVSCAFQTDTVVKKVGKAYNNITDR